MTSWTIDTDFPGGNILIDAVDGDTVMLRQDRRDTEQWWFYWQFRVRGARGRRLAFRFTDGDVFAALGPCVSRDRVRWEWLGREVVRENGFDYAFALDEQEVYFSFCIPYQQADLEQFLATRPAVVRQVLAQSEKGREVEHLLLPSMRGTWKALFTARHHCCETMANYEMEGIMDFRLGDDPDARFLREEVDLHLVPFMDKDGAEQGDQGKQRAPHDHNRDYTDAPIYASVRELMRQAPAWRGRWGLVIDLHCPWIRQGRNEEIFIAEPAPEWLPQLDDFRRTLVALQSGELSYDPKNDIAMGEDWHIGEADTSARFFSDTQHTLAFTLEFPYALAGGKPVTAANARAFGRDLARAVARVLQQAARLPIL